LAGFLQEQSSGHEQAQIPDDLPGQNLDDCCRKLPADSGGETQLDYSGRLSRGPPNRCIDIRRLRSTIPAR